MNYFSIHIIKVCFTIKLNWKPQGLKNFISERFRKRCRLTFELKYYHPSFVIILFSKYFPGPARYFRWYGTNYYSKCNEFTIELQHLTLDYKQRYLSTVETRNAHIVR